MMHSGKDIEKWIKGYRIPSTKEKEDVWIDLMSKMPVSEKVVHHPYRFKRWFYLAASILVAAVLLTFVFDTIYGTRKYFTDGGQQQTIILPDSTRVKLNPSSELNVNYSFITGKRKLRLIGEALFDVTPGRLFTVNFGTGKVSVLGTRFSISAYKNMKPEVNCLSGKVKVTIGRKVTVLKPGKGVTVGEKDNPVTLNIQNQKILSELNGLYEWKNVSLGTIFKIIDNFTGYRVSGMDEIKNENFRGI